MIDFTPNSNGTIFVDLENNDAPLTGATVKVTITDPNGTALITAQAAAEVGNGTYSYSLGTAQTATIGTYQVVWVVSVPLDLQVNTTYVVGYQSVFGVSRLDLRHSTGRTLGDLYLGSVTSATTTTVVDTGRYEPDGAFTGQYFYIYGGTGKGQERRITNWTQSTQTYTFTTPFNPAPDSTSLYEVHKVFTTDEYNQAIRQAVWDIADTYFVPISDASIVLNSNQTRYPIPPGFSHVFEVQVNMIEDITDKYQKVAPAAWYINRANRELCLHGWIVGPWTSHKVRLLGLRPPTDPLDDTTEIDVRPTFIIKKAASILAFSRMKARENDPEGWTFKYQMLAAEAMQERSLLNKAIPNNTRRVEL